LFYIVLCGTIRPEKIDTMPRPKGRQLPHRVSVALTAEQHAALDELARSNGAAVSWVVRRAVIEFLDRNEPGGREKRLPIGGLKDMKAGNG
jgi:predicted transcriptional regulator